MYTHAFEVSRNIAVIEEVNTERGSHRYRKQWSQLRRAKRQCWEVPKWQAYKWPGEEFRFKKSLDASENSLGKQ